MKGPNKVVLAMQEATLIVAMDRLAEDNKRLTEANARMAKLGRVMERERNELGEANLALAEERDRLSDELTTQRDRLDAIMSAWRASEREGELIAAAAHDLLETLKRIAVPGNGSHWGRIARVAIDKFEGLI